MNKGFTITNKSKHGFFFEVFSTFSATILTTLLSSATTRSMHLRLGSLRRVICFFTMASNAMSGVKRPTLMPKLNGYDLFCSGGWVAGCQLLNELTVNVSDRKCNFFSQFFLIEFHPDYLIRKPLVEQSVDLGAAAELHGVDRRGPAALDRPLEVLLQLLDHLQHRLGLDARVVGLEVLVLLHLLLQAQHLPLQPVPERGQRVPDVVGQLGVQLLLEPGRAASVRDVSVRRVREEEFSLGSLRRLDIFSAINIFLASVHNSNISPSQRKKFVFKNILGVCTIVHQV